MTEDARSPEIVCIIVGMHRSGTSSIGRLLESVGFDFGDNLLEGIDSINDRGFWEDRDVVALNEHIFQLYGSNWFDFERLPGKWWEDSKIKDLVGVAETWFQEGFSHEKPIAVKDPRFCRLLPFWKRVFLGMGIRPHILFVIRHPAEVAASIKRRDGFSLQVGYLLWLAYVIDGLYYSRNLELTIVDYQSLLAHPERVASRLAKTDVASIHGLSEQDLLARVKDNLDVESRHQRVDNVFTRGEVQGDVQSLAHELYDVLLNATPDDAKAVADKYRKRFYRLLDHHKEVLSALQATVNKHVETNQKLTEIGSGHSYALSVIEDKDKQLEENKDFIAKCLAEIGNKESQLALTQQELERSQIRISEQEILNKKNVALWDRFEELQQITHGRELKLSESLAYIEKCEAWIGELNLLSEDGQRILTEQRDYITRCEARIREQDQWLADNTDYIGKCEARIREQDSGFAENRDYIERCEARIRELDEALLNRDHLLAERLDKISGYDRRMVELEHLLHEKQKAFDAEAEVIRRERSDFEERSASYDKAVAELQQCHERIRQLEGNAESREIVLNETKQKIELLQANLSDERKVGDQKGIEIANLAKQLSDRNMAIQQRETNLAAQLKQIAEQKQTLTEYDAKVTAQENILSANATEIEKYKMTIADMEKQIADLVQLKDQHKAAIASQLADIDSNQKHIHDLEVSTAALKSEIQALVVDKENLGMEMSRMQQLDQLNKQRIALQKKQLDGGKSHAAALESELVAINTQMQNLQQELERYRSYRVVKLIDKFAEANS